MTRQLPFLFLRHYIFWMLVFVVVRSIFLCWNTEELSGAGFGEIISVYAHAIYLDTATACYFLIPPFLFLTLATVLKKKWILKVNRGFTILLLVCVSLITFGDLPIYDEWHTKLNYKALWFFGNPAEVFHTASPVQLISGILFTIFLTWILFRLYKKICLPDEIPPVKPWWGTITFFLGSAPLIFLGMRGGWQPIPIQVSDAYYSSTHNVLNLTSVNSTFNLLSSCIENLKADEPYRFIPADEAKKIFTEMNAVEKDSTIHILKNDRPNVVLVVLESWSADLVKSCGGYDSICPFFDSMADSGLLFSDCYASGSLSDQGMAAVFSGFPAQPLTSVITQPEKYVHLPCINSDFEKAGYHTSFMFGGQLSYGNIKAYMYHNGFDKIIEGDDFDASIPQGRLGVADEYLFNRQLAELSKEQQPFFAAMFTLSTHGPFDFPMEEKLHWGEKEKPFINSVLYADNCIRNFINQAKKQSWYDNTLFVFVSDHSHNSPKNWAFNQSEYRRIPMLFYGNAIKPEYRGMKYEKIASQTDLAATLLAQLNLDISKYRYSKNLLNPYSPSYAYYAFGEGFGLVKPEGKTTWHVKDGRQEYEQYDSPGDKARITKEGKAFLQVLMDEYFSF